MEQRRVGPVTFAFGRASEEPCVAIGVFFFFGHADFAVHTHPEERDVADPLAVTDDPKRSPLWTPGDPRP
jgi:hypothetical protein